MWKTIQGKQSSNDCLLRIKESRIKCDSNILKLKIHTLNALLNNGGDGDYATILELTIHKKKKLKIPLKYLIIGLIIVTGDTNRREHYDIIVEMNKGINMLERKK